MWRRVRSKEYNYDFNNKTGFFARWGRTAKEDPDFSPIGPEIADIEISTICGGLGVPCAWCYKSNTEDGYNMNLESFKKLFHKLPKNLTQIAFGIGDIDSNPDMFPIFEYCRNNDYNSIVPNVTISGYNLQDHQADKLADLCGAVAVSRYAPVDHCYNAIKMLTDRGMEQVNIHMILSKDTYGRCEQALKDAMEDSRLAKMNAIVFLSLKPKGIRNTLSKLGSVEKFKSLVDFALENDVRIGFDSCSAPIFLEAVKDHEKFDMFQTLAEPCESTLFSLYINAEGKYFPCSFLEQEQGHTGIDVLNCDDFLEDVWFHPEVVHFREVLLGTSHESFTTGCRSCPAFDLY